MKGETFVNGKAIGNNEVFKIDNVWRFLQPRADIKVENTPWFGGKTKITTSFTYFKRRFNHTSTIDVGDKPIRIGLPILGGVVVKRVALNK